MILHCIGLIKGNYTWSIYAFSEKVHSVAKSSNSRYTCKGMDRMDIPPNENLF